MYLHRTKCTYIRFKCKKNFICLTACLLTFERFKMNNCKNTVRLLVLWIRILAYYFSNIHLHNSSNIKKSLKSHKPAEIKVFLALFLLDEGRILTRTNYDRSGSGKPKTYGSWSTTPVSTSLNTKNVSLPFYTLQTSEYLTLKIQ